jgi:hypothetical protein
MLAYTFLIPILPELYQAAQGYGEIDLSNIILRIVSFVGITYSGVLVKKLIQQVIKRFKS